MIGRNGQLRAEKVRDAYRRIESGFYYRWEYKIVREIVEKDSKRTRRLLRELGIRPAANGDLCRRAPSGVFLDHFLNLFILPATRIKAWIIHMVTSKRACRTLDLD